jgi:general secretion pathway protein G
LVSAGYLREVPADPITRTKDSWVTVSDDTLASPDQSSPGVTDVHSSSQELSSEGSAYNTW